MVRSPSGLRSITMGRPPSFRSVSPSRKMNGIKGNAASRNAQTVTSSTITYEIGMIIIIGF